MNKIAPFLVSLVLFAGCSYESKTVEENCTMNGRAVDCRDMGGSSDPAPRPPAKPTPVPVPTKPAGFKCGFKSCDVVTEFCFEMRDRNGILLSADCQPQDMNCRTCECLDRRVLAVYPNECSVYRACFNLDGEKYTYSCRDPQR